MMKNIVYHRIQILLTWKEFFKSDAFIYEWSKTL